MKTKLDRDFYRLYLKLKMCLDDAPEEDPAFIVVRLKAKEVKSLLIAIESLESIVLAAAKVQVLFDKYEKGGMYEPKETRIRKSSTKKA